MFRRFSGTAQSRFTPAPGGGYLFRPHGAFGRGYRVDEASKARIEKTLNRFYFWAILLLMLLVFAVWPFSAKLFPGQPKLGALAAALFVVAVGGVFVVTAYWLVARWACAGMQADAASLGVSGALAQRAAKVSAFRFQFLLAVSAVLVAACLW
jgi:cation transport ATPase